MRFSAWRKRFIAMAISLAAVAAMATVVVEGAPTVAYATGQASNPHPEDVVASAIVTQGDHDSHLIKYRSGIETIDGAVAASSLKPPANGKTGKSSDDYKAYAANGYQPIVVNPADMVLSTSGMPTEVTPPNLIPNCVSPPKGWNIAKASDNEIVGYGFPTPPIDPKARAIYNQKQAPFTQRVCTSVSTNLVKHVQATVSTVSPAWSGYIADQNACSYSIGGNSGIGCAPNTPNYYSEADTDYNVPCIANGGSGLNTARASHWVGVGGAYSGNGGDELIQTGSESDENYGIYTYWTWWEYVNMHYVNPDGVHTVAAQAFNITGDPRNNLTGGINCGTHIYARVDACDHMELGDLNTGKYYSVYEGPCTMGASAEFITECPSGACANYGWATYHGVGLTAKGPAYCPNSCYIPMTGAENDLIFNIGSVSKDALQDVGSLATDIGDPPDDQFTTWWLSAS